MQKPIRVNVLGHGIVEFPAGTSEDVMRKALEGLKVPETQTPAPPRSVPEQPLGELRQVFRNSLGDAIIGALKGGGETAINLGALLHKIPGVSEVVDKMYGQPGLSAVAFDAAKAYTEPTNAMQSLGKGVEQVAELFVPATKIGQLGRGVQAMTRSRVPSGVASTVAPTVARMAVEGTGGAAMSAAQGGDATLGGALAAGVPLVSGAAAAVPDRFRAQAAKQVMQALGPTKEKYKAIAERITPSVLKRGLMGSRESLRAQANQLVQELGQEIDTAIQAYGARTASTQSLVDALEASKEPFLTRTASGQVVPLDKRALGQIKKLQEVITGEFDSEGRMIAEGIGDTATVEQLVAIRRAWDKIVSQAGGHQHRADGAIGVPLADQSEAAIKREGATAIRELLDAEVPELAAINKEYSFWKSLNDVLTQTIRRTQPQSEGLGRKIAQATGGSIGGFASSAGGTMAIIGGAGLGVAAIRMLDKVITSPRWALTSAVLKDRLANALASGNHAKIIDTLGQITAVQASKVGR